MTTKKLRSVTNPPGAPQGEEAAPLSSPRLQPARLREIAEQMGTTQLQERGSSGRTSVLINLRVQMALADWLAEQARAEGTTQKVIITRALAAAGAPVSPLDLTDRTPRRRRS
jgi:hypothetical protein